MLSSQLLWEYPSLAARGCSWAVLGRSWVALGRSKGLYRLQHQAERAADGCSQASFCGSIRGWVLSAALGRFLVALGSLLGRSWSLKQALEPSRRGRSRMLSSQLVREHPSMSARSRSWAVLGRFLVALVPLFGCSWPLKGAPEPTYQGRERTLSSQLLQEHP